MDCRVCGKAVTPLFETRVLRKYDTTFDRCGACGFIQAHAPHWLEEAYGEAINEIDIGPVNRAVTGAETVEGLILATLDPKGRFLDYGAGYGLFVRRMRDRGFDFHWYDAHCDNIFAKHFAHAPGDHYDLVTAFEVFEHLVDPVAELGKILALGDNVFFTTDLVPDGIARAEDWFYFGVDHGQHIAFFTRQALQILAEKNGLHLSTNGWSMHMLSQRPISDRLFKLLVNGRRMAKAMRFVMRRRAHVGSLLASDFDAISGRAAA